MKIFGHRGAAGLVAENTLASFAKAVALGVAGVELDVHRCKSGEIVVIHDFTVDRTTNGVGAVHELTLTELKALAVEDQFDIPTLAEVLDLIDARCQVNIELKGSHTALPVLELIKQYCSSSLWNLDQFIVSSFDHTQLLQLYQLDKTLKIGVLTEGPIEEVLTLAQEIEAFSIHPNVLHCTPSAVARVQDFGFKLYVWTVNKKSAIEKLIDLKVDAIITDFPNFAL
ncbi:glycerophosphodiester phosphodiesterase [Aquimarina brevivitae]|uniref:Glycerophosphoryl diester phosphodiesterase n=1 Tax=Aquimarina brevivitae TaxID=323412 RepID=A0A4Q7PIU4_9FLAO|nr:glycerophosphodiester phosphodiesterase family protein [Aquimarina brevivitae]RZS99750.1 glycerophosphoryl diester phosphodiesterase [Aquimarina brevivitae]